MSAILQMSGRKFSLVWALCLALMLGNGIAVAAPDLQLIESLYHQGKVQEAYKLANQYLPVGEGDPKFDYLYGRIAIDSGDVSLGVFALERVLLFKPNHHYARLELARGYFILGQADRAKAEFDEVLAADPSQAIRDKIAQYLKAVRSKQSAYKTSKSGYAEFTFGLDTNINSASSIDTFTAPTLGTGVLSEDSLSQRSMFGEVGLGGLATHPIAEGRFLFAAADLHQRVNQESNEFDTGTLDIRGGLSMVEGDKQLRLTAAAQKMTLDYSEYRELANLTLDGQFAASPEVRLNGYVQGGAISYPNLDNRDVYTGSVGFGVTKQTNWRFKPQFSAMAFLGVDDPMKSNAVSKELAEKESAGLSFKGTYQIREHSLLDLTFLWQNSQYQEIDSVFLVKREDDFTKLGIGYTREINNDWKLKLEFSHSELRSNISIYEYERDQVSVGFRYEY